MILYTSTASIKCITDLGSPYGHQNSRQSEEIVSFLSFVFPLKFLLNNHLLSNQLRVYSQILQYVTTSVHSHNLFVDIQYFSLFPWSFKGLFHTNHYIRIISFSAISTNQPAFEQGDQFTYVLSFVNV